jgi:hypothetical protein
MCEHDGVTGQKLIWDLTPIQQEWLSAAYENSDRFFKNSNQSKTPFYYQSQVLGTRYSIDGEPVSMFVDYLIERGADKATGDCYIGRKKNAQAAAAKRQDLMKDLALKSPGAPFLQIDDQEEQ